MKRKIKYRLTCRLGGLTPANTENRGCPAGLQHDLGEKMNEGPWKRSLSSGKHRPQETPLVGSQHC